MRALLLVALCAAGACAGSSRQQLRRSSADPTGETASAPGEGQPEIVRTGKQLNLSYSDASARYAKGARCGGGDAPETIIGAPDQRNEMQQGKDRLVTYGYRFREGTLLIRCRGDRVEVRRTLK